MVSQFSSWGVGGAKESGLRPREGDAGIGMKLFSSDGTGLQVVAAGGWVFGRKGKACLCRGVLSVRAAVQKVDAQSVGSQSAVAAGAGEYA